MLLAEALAAGADVRTVFVEPSGRSHQVVLDASRAGVEVREVQEGALGKVLDVVNPQAVVSVVGAASTELPAVMGAAARSSRPVLVLVSIQDPGNAGTLVRVAEAAGCAGLVLTEHSVDVHNPKTVRATAGAVFRLPVVEGVTADAVQAAATGAGIPTWAMVRADGVAPEDADLAAACVLFVGSEAHGLPDEVRDSADGRLSIPMEGAAESLNAAVAGALVAFEAARQRRRRDR